MENGKDLKENDPIILLRLAKAGDTQAFGRLYEIYFTPVYRYIYFRVRHKEVAEDLTQTVFLKIFQSLQYFREQGSAPLFYFLRSAKNAVIDYWRKKKEILLDESQNNILNQRPDENSQKLIEEKNEIYIIQQALAGLPEKQQEVIILRFINDMAHEDIARFIGKSSAAVRQLQSRALKALRLKLDRHK